MGGVGDVVRDLPHALGDAGWDVQVATPSYGSLHELPGAVQEATIDVEFRGDSHAVDVWRIEDEDSHVRHVVFDHARFAAGGAGQIYHRDPDTRPYATDASNFAFYCAIAAAWIDSAKALPDVIHLHDWHSSFFLLLTESYERYRRLRDIRTVFTVHNLSYQGIRPLADDESSLAEWFPDLEYDLDDVVDPEFVDCMNPMRMAIRLADRVSTVSPTYAEEICRASDPAAGFIGGEWLEEDLVEVRDEGRLFGVLNGCYYDQPFERRPGWQRLCAMMKEQLEDWRKRDPSNVAHEIALDHLGRLPKRRPQHVLTSVGRLVPQKATLLLEEYGGESALQRIATRLAESSVILILGSGDPHLEELLLRQSRFLPNVVFLHGYSETLAAPFYHAGDLFLMPSSFEPCGISQMLAMRAGQPCVVHGVGGLRDTVRDNVTGFVFGGDSPATQADAFVTTTERALSLRAFDPLRWQELCETAAAERFDWARSARQTIEKLYLDEV